MRTPKPITGCPAGYLNAEQVMQLTGLSYEALRRATARGELYAVKICSRLLYPIHRLPGHEVAHGTT